MLACNRTCTWDTLVTNSLLLTKVKSFNINDEIKSTDALCRQHHMHSQSTLCHQIRPTAIYRLLLFHSILLRASGMNVHHHHQLSPIVDRPAFFPFVFCSVVLIIFETRNSRIGRIKSIVFELLWLWWNSKADEYLHVWHKRTMNKIIE